MARTDINNLREAEIDTIEGVLDVLRNYTDQEFLSNKVLQEACRNFLGEDWEEYKDSREKVIGRLEKMEPELDTEDAQITAEEIRMEPKAFNAKELEEFEMALKRAQENKAQKVDYKQVVEEFVKGQQGRSNNQVLQAIEMLTRIAKVADQENVTVSTAEKIVEATEEIKSVAPELGQEKAKEMAVEAVRGEISKKTEKEIGKEAVEVLKDLKEEIVYETEVKEIEIKLVEELVESNPELKPVIEKFRGVINQRIRGEVQQITPEEIKGILDEIHTNNADMVSQKVALEAEAIIKPGKDTVEKLKAKAEEKALLKSIREENGNKLSQEQYVTTKKYVKTYVQWSKNTEDVLKETEERIMPKSRQVSQSEKVASDQANLYKTQAQTLGKIIKTNPGKFNELVKLGERLNKLGVKIGPTNNPKFEVVDKVVKMVNGNPVVTKSLAMAQRLEAIDRLINQLPQKAMGYVALKLGAESMAKNLAAKAGVQYIAGKTAEKFLHQTALAIERYGLEQGLGLAIKTAALKVASSATAGATSKTLASALVAVLGGASGPPGWVITAIAMLLMQLLEWGVGLLKKIKGKLDDFLASMGWDIKTGLGGIVDSGLTGAGLIVGSIFAFFGAVGGILTVSTVGLLAVIIVPIVWVQMQTSNFMKIVTMIVPNKTLGGGNCVLIQADKEAVNNPLANCNAGGNVSGTTNINKENFKQMAGGSVNADRCFADVVDRAKRAGVDPEFALLIWLQESGGSNYAASSNVADFGQSALGNRHDFNNQISMFLGLYPETKCINTPKVGNDYWLAWATNFATGDSGENCDPNKVVGGVSGQQYLDKIKTQWSQLTKSEKYPNGAPFPKSMRTSNGGVTGTTETVQENGDVLICDINPNSPDVPGDQPIVAHPTRDPSIPIPEGCPNRWPVEANMPVTQGSKGPTHTKIPGLAIDIMPKDNRGRANIGGQEVVVTHPGVVVYSGYSGGAYGNLIIVRGTCGGKNFETYYAHLMDSQLVSPNTTVTAGQTIGLADNSGNYPVGNDHLHYEIRGCASADGHCSGVDGFNPFQYLPVDVPDNCFWNDACKIDGEYISTKPYNELNNAVPTP